MPTVYTAIFGPYDTLKEPRVRSPGWRYLCFTDQPLTGDTWEVVRVPRLAVGSTRTARFHKLLGFAELGDEHTLWIDGSFRINCNLDDWWSARFRAPMTFLYHPLRSCFYQEALACVRNGRAPSVDIRRQLAAYQTQGLPRRNGMIASGIILRQRTDEVLAFCSAWWNELAAYSQRDQLAWARVAWERPGDFHVTRYHYAKGRDFIFYNHKARKRYA